MVPGKPSLYEAENAFQPAKEISDIDRFAGRAKPVRDAFLALMADGANLAIVGNRVIAHPAPASVSPGRLADITNRTVSRTEARLAFAVLTTERKAA
jgi:hypothetical protein